MAKHIRSPRDKGIVAAIDIGGSKAACVIAECAPYGAGVEADILGVGQHGSIEREKLSDIATSVRTSVELAEKMAGERIRSAYVVAGGRSLGCRLLGVDLDLVGGCVTTEDVDDILAEAARAAAPSGSTPLHAMPVRYKIDDEPVLDDPVGLFGDVLAAEVIGLSVRDSYIANVEALLEQCSLNLDGVIARPFATAETVLIADEKELGVILVDIGSRTTDYAIYERGVMVACGGINVGGSHITRDIAQIFGTPIVSAERLKTLHGSSISGQGDEHRLIDCPQLGSDDDKIRIAKSELTAVISPRIEEIMELVLDLVPQRSSIRRAVLTGGGSLLVGSRETAEKVFKVKTRAGRPASLAGAPDVAQAPQFAASIGAIQYAVHETVRQRRSLHKGTSSISFTSKPGSFFSVASAWLKQNF